MFWRRKRIKSDFSEEIETHLALEAERLREAGLAPGEAIAAARRAFGNRTHAEERCYERARWLFLDHFSQDLRYAARTLRRSPGFTAIALLTLALAIGATTAVFSVVNAVLLNPLPFKNANRLVWAWGRFPGGTQAAISPPDFLDFRSQNTAFEHFGAFSPFSSAQNWRLEDHTEQIQGVMVTAGFFEALGITPAAGRIFVPADEQFREPNAAILSYRFWQRAYGGDPAIVGKQARVNRSAVTIVGVAPPSFDYPRSTDFWFPAPMQNPGMQRRTGHFLRPIGLLKAGVSTARAQADLDRIAFRLAGVYPESNKGWGLLLMPLQEVVVGNTRPVLLILFGAVTFVLLIACVNLANLLLARDTVRERELATRIAIGAGRKRILHQLLVESFVLAGLATPLALGLAHFGIAALRAFGPKTMPRLDEVRLDGHVLLFSIALIAFTTLVFGLVPAWLAARSNPRRGLAENARTGLSRRRRLLGSLLIVSETTLSLCLLIAASLLLESLWKTLHTAPGFATHGVLTSELSLPYRDGATRNAFLAGITRKIAALPGVESVGGISEMPMNDELNDTFFRISGRADKSVDEKNDEDFRIVMPEYFRTMRITLLRGRSFADSDSPSAARVMIVDALFASKYFPHEDALGKHLLVSEGTPQLVDREIVGVVSPIRNYALQTPPRPMMYLPHAQSGLFSLHLIVRAANNPLILAEPIRRIVIARDPDVAIGDFRSMDQVVSQSTGSDRFTALLLGAFAGLALCLAVAGVYGVFSYIVAQQRHDIGVRMALGGRPKQILGLVLGRGLRLAASGIALGAAAAWFLMQILSNRLYQIHPRDLATYAGASLLLLVAAVGACYLPARRAARLDPMTALRDA